MKQCQQLNNLFENLSWDHSVQICEQSLEAAWDVMKSIHQNYVMQEDLYHVK